MTYYILASPYLQPVKRKYNQVDIIIELLQNAQKITQIGKNYQITNLQKLHKLHKIKNYKITQKLAQKYQLG